MKNCFLLRGNTRKTLVRNKLPVVDAGVVKGVDAGVDDPSIVEAGVEPGELDPPGLEAGVDPDVEEPPDINKCNYISVINVYNIHLSLQTNNCFLLMENRRIYIRNKLPVVNAGVVRGVDPGVEDSFVLEA
ncbi:hypothetical protein AVEN_117062-1 [Araneus ventricosus]|uniref:Uncharacterized protein n=1 Tax=Araneus ventricosus TaxID=182803 RepID=A0A4Y2I0Y6_ARAVE|nr:hypothetical protein AVEN_117062-1 [Araneus ventricosus]